MSLETLLSEIFLNGTRYDPIIIDSPESQYLPCGEEVCTTITTECAPAELELQTEIVEYLQRNTIDIADVSYPITLHLISLCGGATLWITDEERDVIDETPIQTIQTITLSGPGDPITINNPVRGADYIDDILITTTDPTCDAPNSGSILITITGPGASGITQFSIDGGDAYQFSPLFQNLTDGGYIIRVSNTDGSISASYDEVVTLQNPCLENDRESCGDGIDNDNDGLVDCDDPECEISPDCNPDIYCEVLGLIQTHTHRFSEVVINRKDELGNLIPARVNQQALIEILDDISYASLTVEAEVSELNQKIEDSFFLNLATWNKRGDRYAQRAFAQSPLVGQVEFSKEYRLKAGPGSGDSDPEPYSCPRSFPPDCQYTIEASSCLHGESASASLSNVFISLIGAIGDEDYAVNIYSQLNNASILGSGQLKGDEQRIIPIPTTSGKILIVVTNGECQTSTTIDPFTQGEIVISGHAGDCLEDLQQQVYNQISCPNITETSCINWVITDDIVIGTSEECGDEVVGPGTIEVIITEDGEIILEEEVTLIIYLEEEDCSMPGDQEGDGLDNCSDPDCQGTLVDDNNDGVWDGCGPENTKDYCIDGLDNDNDGLTDCDDPDCAAFKEEHACQLDLTITFRVADFECTEGAICYELVLHNNGGGDFNIENLNFPLSVGYPICGCFDLQSHGLLLDPESYTLVVPSYQSSSPSLLTANANLMSSQTPTTIAVGGELPIYKICFDINSDIRVLQENDCFRFETRIRGTHAVNGGGSTDIITPWILPNEFNDQPCLSELCAAEGPEDSPTACSDGIDNDHDGLTDCQDGDCSTIDPLVVRIALESEDDCGEGQGQIKVTLPEGTNMTDYSICIGENCADLITGIISGLSAGEHEITITNSLGCLIEFEVSQEICDNGEDHDGDGFIDCYDPDCEDILYSNNNKSSISCAACMSEYHDLFYELEIVDEAEAIELCTKLSELDILLEENPFALVEGCLASNERSKFFELALFTPPQEVIDNLNNRGEDWDLQNIFNAKGALVNMDYFEICFDGIPNNMSPQEFLMDIMANWFGFDNSCNSTFKFHDDLIDAPLWNSGDPVHTIFDIEIGLITPEIQADDGVVVTSAFDNFECLCWTFTTIGLYTNFNDEYQHPVSGNRQFGLVEKNDGSWCFYTRAIDRISNGFGDKGVFFLDELFSKIGLTGADQLWKCLFSSIGEHYGSTNEVCGLNVRPHWQNFKELIKDLPLQNSISCLKTDVNCE